MYRAEGVDRSHRCRLPPRVSVEDRQLLARLRGYRVPRVVREKLANLRWRVDRIAQEPFPGLCIDNVADGRRGNDGKENDRCRKHQPAPPLASGVAQAPVARQQPGARRQSFPLLIAGAGFRPFPGAPAVSILSFERLQPLPHGVGKRVVTVRVSQAFSS